MLIQQENNVYLLLAIKDCRMMLKQLLLSLGQRVNQANINRKTNFSDDVNIYPLQF